MWGCRLPGMPPDPGLRSALRRVLPISMPGRLAAALSLSLSLSLSLPGGGTAPQQTPQHLLPSSADCTQAFGHVRAQPQLHLSASAAADDDDDDADAAAAAAAAASALPPLPPGVSASPPLTQMSSYGEIFILADGTKAPSECLARGQG